MILNLGYTVDTYFLAVSLADRYLDHIGKNGIEDIPNINVMAATSVMLAAKIDTIRADISKTI